MHPDAIKQRYGSPWKEAHGGWAAGTPTDVDRRGQPRLSRGIWHLPQMGHSCKCSLEFACVNRGLEFFKVSFRVRLSYSWKQSWNWILQCFSRGAESIFFNWWENNCALKHQQGLWNTPPHSILPIHHHHNLHSGTNDKRQLAGQISQTLLGRAQGPGPSDDMAQKIKRKIPGLQGISPGPG